MLKRSIVIVVILTLFATLVFPAYANGKSNVRVAKVIELKGDVKIHKKGLTSSFNAFKGMSLSEGDIIKTGKGSSLTMMVDEYKDIQLSENSRLDISTLKGSIESKNDQTKLQLWNGKVWVDIKKTLNVDSKFEIKTPTSIAGVRGTKFFVGYEDNQLDVGVLTGRVETEVFNYEVTAEGDIVKKNSVTMLEKNESLSYDRAAQMPDTIKKQPLDIRKADTFIQEIIISNAQYIQYLDPETLKTENLTPELSELIKKNNGGNSTEAPGNSDNAPGQTNTPGKQPENPGNSDNAPGQTNTPAKQPKNAGNSDNAPGNSGNAPGNSVDDDESKGHSSDALGNARNARNNVNDDEDDD